MGILYTHTEISDLRCLKISIKLLIRSIYGLIVYIQTKYLTMDVGLIRSCAASKFSLVQAINMHKPWLFQAKL